MKRTILLAAVLTATFLPSLWEGSGMGFAQNIGINTDSSSPETGIMLDMKAVTNKATTSTINLFQLKSFDADADALKLRFGIQTHLTATSRYGFLQVADYSAGVPTYRALSLQPSGGNVGIGTTTPTYTLHVVGKIKTDNINETSDIRYKTNITTIGNALEKTLALRGVYFNWDTLNFPDRNFSSVLQVGLIAQETEKVFPLVVDTDKDGYKSIEYSKLTSLLIEAIKDLSAEVQKTKTEQQQLIEQQQKLMKEQQSLNNSQQGMLNTNAEKITELTTEIKQLKEFLQLKSEK